MPDGKKDGEDQQGSYSLFSFASAPPPQLAEPTLDRLPSGVTQRDVQSYIAGTASRQSMYSTASGTLTQFNAILVGLNGVALPTSAGAVKILFPVGLLAHVAAAFVLCWAARPVMEKLAVAQPIQTAISHYRHTDHTFRNYRRGWRMTLLALVVSSLAASLFVLKSFDTTIDPDLLRSWIVR